MDAYQLLEQLKKILRQNFDHEWSHKCVSIQKRQWPIFKVMMQKKKFIQYCSLFTIKKLFIRGNIQSMLGWGQVLNLTLIWQTPVNVLIWFFQYATVSVKKYKTVGYFIEKLKAFVENKLNKTTHHDFFAKLVRHSEWWGNRFINIESFFLGCYCQFYIFAVID